MKKYKLKRDYLIPETQLVLGGKYYDNWHNPIKDKLYLTIKKDTKVFAEIYSYWFPIKSKNIIFKDDNFMIWPGQRIYGMYGGTLVEIIAFSLEQDPSKNKFKFIFKKIKK